MQHLRLLAAGLLSLAALGSAQALTVPVLPGSGWQEFVVDDPAFSIAGTDFAWHDPNGTGDIFFTFTVPAGQIGSLVVVDAGFAGDVFSVRANNAALSNTGAAVNSYPTPVFDYGLALTDARFSRNAYTFGAGNYTVTGALATSALDDLGAPLNSTVGALRLTVAPVPESSTLAMLLAGLGVLGLLARRRAV